MKKTDFFHVALIIGAHGVRGEVKLLPLSERPNRLQELSDLSLMTAGGLFVRRLKFRSRKANGHEIAELEGINDREEAEALKGYYLSVSREQAAPLPEGRYYISDLIGLKVIDASRGEIGCLKAVRDNGAQDVYEIARQGKKPLFLAITKETFQSADLFRGEIYVQLPDGLWEVYE